MIAATLSLIAPYTPNMAIPNMTMPTAIIINDGENNLDSKNSAYSSYMLLTELPTDIKIIPVN